MTRTHHEEYDAATIHSKEIKEAVSLDLVEGGRRREIEQKSSMSHRVAKEKRKEYRRRW